MLAPALVAGIVALLPLVVHLVHRGAVPPQSPRARPCRWRRCRTQAVSLRFVMAIAGGVFLQGIVVLYCRVIVSHVGDDVRV
jgi:hypothetical protein